MPQKEYQTHCQWEGCTETHVDEWSIEGYDPVPVFLYCANHAVQAGFCLSCGAFIGGTEDIFLTGSAGLCFECFLAEEREYDRVIDFDEDEDEA